MPYITGIPTQPGPFTVTMTVTDAAGTSASATQNLFIDWAVLTVVTDLPPGTAGYPYDTTLAAYGGTPPYSWTVTGLPDGLTADPAGHITGIPDTDGTFTSTVTVTDITTATATATLALEIAQASALEIGDLPAELAAGSGVSLTLPVSGGVPPYAWVLAGLPPGLAQSGGTLTGRPDTPGTYTIAVQVIDAGGRIATATWSVHVRAGPVHVWWDDLDCSPGWVDGQFTAVVTDVTGWFDTPVNEGHDTTLVLADGGIYGPKTLDPRTITIQGAAAGPRTRLMAFRDQLALRTVKRVPGTLTIDDWTEGPRTATVRASSDQLTYAWLAGSQAFTWQVVLTANDPRIYGEQLTAILLAGEEGTTGRTYPRQYRWQYFGTTGMPNIATMVNDGDTDTPVTAVYTGPLGQTRLVASGSTTGIIIGALPAGQTITVNCETLTARAPGGAIRQSMIGAGSRPMPLPPGTQTWWLFGTGDGTVTLTWRPAWL